MGLISKSTDLSKRPFTQQFMPENASSSRNTSYSGHELLSIKASLVETNANQLMDELFAELEQDLDGSLTTPAVSPVSTQALSVNYYLLETPSAADRGLSAIRQAAQSQASQWSLKSLLLPGAASAAAVTLLLWIGQLQQPKAVAPPGVEGLDSAADREFALYMQRSLARINQNIQKQAAPASTQVPQTINLPTPNSPASANPKTSPRVVKVPERVYIPVYQPPQPQATSPKPSPAAKEEKAASPAPEAKNTAVAQSATLAPEQTLVGVLELGDRSAALVGADGTTRRVHVGESLGPGGWSLVKVTGQKAIIQRQGELRSLYVGQKF